MAITDGTPVTCQGDQGQVLITDGVSAHVLWSSGARAGQVDLVFHGDLREEPGVLGQLRDALSFSEDDGGVDQAVIDDLPRQVMALLEERISSRMELTDEETPGVEERIRVASARVLREALHDLEADDD